MIVESKSMYHLSMILYQGIVIIAVLGRYEFIIRFSLEGIYHRIGDKEQCMAYLSIDLQINIQYNMQVCMYDYFTIN